MHHRVNINGDFRDFWFQESGARSKHKRPQLFSSQVLYLSVNFNITDYNHLFGVNLEALGIIAEDYIFYISVGSDRNFVFRFTLNQILSSILKCQDFI